MKYIDTAITFREVPDEVSLCINISNCPYRCKGCHSPELQENKGKELNIYGLEDLIKKNQGITCVCFLGGDASVGELFVLSDFVRYRFNLKTCWYSGNDNLEPDAVEHFDYIKIGHYDEERGPLDSPNTNQKFFAVKKVLYDMTDYFQVKDAFVDDDRLAKDALAENIIK